MISASFCQAQVTPSVSISSNATNNSLCRGTAVTFTATPTNGGATPTYQWRKNGVNSGTGATLTLNNIVNNDAITVVMTTSLSAAQVTSTTATSNSIATTVNNLPSVVSTTPASITSCLSTGSATINATPSTGSVIDWYASTTATTPLLSSSNSYTTPNISATTTYYAVARDTVTGCQSNGVTAQSMALNFGPGIAYVQTTKPVTGSFTIEFWMKSNYTSSAGNSNWRSGEGLVDASTSASNNDFGVTMFNKYVKFGLGNPDISITTTSLMNGSGVGWKHVAATWDSTTGAMKLYVNGVLEASATGGTASRNGQTAMRLGTSLSAPANWAYGNYSGTLDEVRIWSKVKTQAEILANMNMNANGREANLAAYYNFNQGIWFGNNGGLTTLYDISPNRYNGTLNNFTSLNTGGNQMNYVDGYGLNAAQYPVTVTKSSTPTVASSTSGAIVCGGGSTTVSATASAGAKIDWYADASGGTALATGIGTYTTPTLSATTTYYAEARDTVTGCVSASRTSVTATVNGTPTAGITNNTGSTVLTCTRTSISVTATGGSSYSWSNSLGTSANASITAAGTYTATVTGANGCQATSSITVTRDAIAPTAGITNNTGSTVLTCATTAISLTATGGATYSWSNSLGSSANASITAAGTYTVTVTGSNGCTATSSITVTRDVTIPTAGITNNTGSTLLNCSRNSISVTATGGVSYSWDNSSGSSATASITAPGNYTVTATGANGCTSTASVSITQNISTSTGDTTAFACNSFSWYGTTYNSSATPTHTFSNVNGCDSVVTLHLTVGYANTGDTSVAACNNFTWYGTTYNSSATPTHTFTNASGCDSVVTANIVINYSTRSSFNDTACNTLTLPWGQTVTTSGSYNHTYQTVNGCDSVVTANIVINNSTTSSFNDTACNTLTLPWGQTVTTSGNYNHTYQTVNGCDSVVTAEIVVNYSTTSSFNDTACNTLTLPWGQTVTTSGSYNHTYQTVNGCDSVVTANIVINYSTTSSFNDTACNTLTLPWSQVVTTSGNYNHTYQTVNGCDSVVTANIVINYSTTSSFNDTACNTLTLPWSQVVTTSGSYNHTYQTVNGCDSVVTANIVINNSTTSSFNDTACNTLTLPWGQTVTTSGNYNHTYQTVNGCDSVVTANIVINYSTSSSFNDTACNTLTLPWGQTVTTSGNYNHTYQTVNGCDSIVTANIVINYSTTSSFNDTACNTMTLPWSQIVTTSGNYNHTYQTVNGCDSVVTANIVINYSTTSSFNDTSCNSLTLPWGTVVTTSGSYNHTYQAVNGCDSVVTANIVINYGTHNTTTQSACTTYTWNGTAYTQSGTYTYAYSNASGCASADTLRLTINTLPAAPVVTNGSRCGTGTVTLSATSSTRTVIDWYESSSATTPLLSASNTYTTPSISTTANYFVVARDTVTGCLSSQPSQPSQPSQVNNALRFDGTNDFISVFTNTGIPIGNSNYTIEAWIKPYVFTSSTNTNGIIGWGDWSLPNKVNAFRLDRAGLLNYWNGPDLITLSSGTVSSIFTAQEWRHVACSYDGTTRKLYVDGVVVASDIPGGHTTPFSSNLKIGTTTNIEYFNGALDEIRVWNLGRTQTQIQANMNSTLTGNETGLVAYYNFDQGVSEGNNTGISTLLDLTSNHNNGTFNNFSLTGTTSNFVSGPSAVVYSPRTVATATVNPLPASAVGVDGSRYGTGTVSLSATVSSGFTVDWYAAESGGAALSTGSTSFTTPSISSTTIYYAQARNTTTGCLSATRTAVTATVNAILVVGVSISSNATNNKICRGTAVAFTATPTNGGNTPTYQWKLNGTNIFTGSQITLNNVQNNDQISVVMTTSLSAANVTSTTATSNTITLTVNNLPSVASTTPANITSCITAGSATINAVPSTGSVIDWYASTSSTTPLLTSSNSYTTPSISTTTTYYPVARDTVTGCQSNGLTAENMAINMGPNNAYIETPKTVTGSFTIEFWFKPAGSSSAGCASWRCGEGLVDANTGDASDRDFGITIYNSYVAFGMGNGSGNPDVSILSTTNVSARSWKHIAASWDSTTGAMKLYVNGNLEASAIGGTASRNGQSLMRLGALLQAPGNGFYGYFSGSLDEVRIWSKVRTQADIQANYTSNINGREDGLAQYYNFNQGIPGNPYNGTQTTLYDITPNGNNGSLNQFRGLGSTGIQGNWWGTFDLGFDPVKYPVVVTKITTPTVSNSSTGATICGSGTTTLTATASAGSKIDWYADASGGTALAIGTNNFTTPTLSATTIYYAEARDSIAGCVSATRTAVTATVGAIPTAGITNNTGSTVLTCTRTSISVTATGGSTYSWSNSLGSSANASITATGTYTVTVTGANGCTATSSITVTRDTTAPTAGITNNTGSTVLTCATTAIGVTATGGATYSWSNSLGSSANASITSAGTYTVTVTGANGCTATSSITTTQDITAPTAGITNNTGSTILNCTTSAISVTATGGVSYSWSNSLGSSANASITAPGTYTVTATGANGCTSTASITVTQDNTATTTSIVNNSLTTELNCNTQSISLNASPMIFENFNNGQWNTSNFTLGAPTIGSGSVVNGAYVDLSGSRSPLRTVNQFHPDANHVLTVSATIKYDYGQSIGYIATRSSGTILNANNEPDGVKMRLHNFNDGQTTLPNGVHELLTTSFYNNPVRVTMIDNGTTVICRLVNLVTLVEHNYTVNNTGSNGDYIVFSGGSKVSWDDIQISYGDPNISYNWVNGNGVTISNSASTNITSPGTYTVTSSASNGCSSSANISITQNISTSAIDTSAFACNSFTWYGTTYTSSATPTKTFRKVNGCDSVITLHLTVGHSNTGDTTAVACNSFAWYGTTYTSSANPTHSFTNASGCDSVVTLHLTITTIANLNATTVAGIKNVCAYMGTNNIVTYRANCNGATSYAWTLPLNTILVSGQGTAIISVKFLPSFAATANKQIRVVATSPCGLSPIAIFYTAVQAPVTPSSIRVSTTNVCPSLGTNVPIVFTIPRVYEALSNGVTATSYIWSAQNGTTNITNINGAGINDTSIAITFNSNFTSSNITVQAVNDCGVSGIRSITLTKDVPPTPGLISGPANVCEYSGEAGSIATYTTSAIFGVNTYTWTLPNGAFAVTGQGTNTVSFRYPTGFTSGTISVNASNGCGTSGTRSLSISTLAPSYPNRIDVINLASCPSRRYSYTISSMPSNAVSLLWTVPAGGTLVSGQGTTSIVVDYTSGVITGSVSVAAVANCGASLPRTSEVKLATCPSGLTAPMALKNYKLPGNENMEVAVYPNPTTTAFNMQVITAAKYEIQVKITDVQGRLIRSFVVAPNQTIAFGNDLKAGVYMVEVREGEKIKTVRVVKY